MFLSLIASGFVQFSDTSKYLSKPYHRVCTLPSVSALYVETSQNSTCSDFMEYSLLGDNYSRLLSFSGLTKGWNGYDAQPFSSIILQNTKNLLMKLRFQPKLFPTARGTVQIEFFKDDDNQFELEVFEDKYFLYIVDHGEETESYVSKEEACDKINNFDYGMRLFDSNKD